VLLIESEIAMRCIEKDAIEGQFDSDRYYQLHSTCTKINAKNGRIERQYGNLVGKTFLYSVHIAGQNPAFNRFTGITDG
jgi:hypothetical protein